MSLTEKVPAFKVGSPDLGGQLRDLAAVVLALCEAEEARLEAAAAPKATAATKTTSTAAKAPVAK